MLTVADRERYQRYRRASAAAYLSSRLEELWWIVLLFGSAGAITWAIRGTDGWGGIDGTVIPGMTWGLLWHFVSCRRGIDARGIPLWLGLGIALGGELGYGQYVSWIQGNFYLREEIVPVEPWIGWVWFTVAGIGWGAPGGIALGWALSGPASWTRWLVRVLLPATFAFLGWLCVQYFPALFFPHYASAAYEGELDRHLARTVYTNTQNFTVVAGWSGALLAAALQRDRATLVVGTLIGGGFGPGFALAALWCLGYKYAPGAIDWWKVWELNAGFHLGLLYACAWAWATRVFDRRQLLKSSRGILSGAVAHRLRGLSLLLAVFVLLYVTLRGASLRLGALLGFYEAGVVNQYEWPPARTSLFVSCVVVLLVGVALQLKCMLREPGRPSSPERVSERVGQLLMGMGLVGVVTIWPSKIGVLYVALLFVCMFALQRLNRFLAVRDRCEDARGEEITP